MAAQKTWEEFVAQMPPNERAIRSAIILNSLDENGALDAGKVYKLLKKHDLFSAFRNEILKQQAKHGPQTGKEQRVGAAARNEPANDTGFYDRHPELKGDGAAIDNRNVIDAIVDALANNKPNPSLTLAFKAKFPKPQPGAKPKMENDNRLHYNSLPRLTR